MVEGFNDDKATSAPSWGLAGWLRLSLAIVKSKLNLLKFFRLIHISKCYRVSENRAYFLDPIVNSMTSY